MELNKIIEQQHFEMDEFKAHCLRIRKELKKKKPDYNDFVLMVCDLVDLHKHG